MKPYSEAEIHDALNAIENGMSIRQASRTWHIPKSTLHDRVTGTQSHSNAAYAQQVLSDYQEDCLVLFIVNQSTLGLALTRFETRALAAKLAYSQPDAPPLGRRWFTAFLARHPEFRSRKNQRVEAKRLKAATKPVIGTWFHLLELPVVKAINKPDNRWNADEGGLMEGRGENALTLGYSNSEPLSQKDFNSRAWTSFLECISATGKSLIPLIIFKGLIVQQQWFPIALSDFEGWQFTVTKKGWIEEKIALEWLRKCLFPVKPRMTQMSGAFW